MYQSSEDWLWPNGHPNYPFTDGSEEKREKMERRYADYEYREIWNEAVPIKLKKKYRSAVKMS